jgi:YD repeat-containing protein
MDSYEWTADGNKTAMREWNAVPACRAAGWDVAPQTTAYAYDGQGRLTGVDYPDGRHAAYSYDGAGNRLTEVETVPAAGGGTRVIKQRRFACDGRNRLRYAKDELRTDYSVSCVYNVRGDLVGRTTGQLDEVSGTIVPGTERQRLVLTWDRSGRLRRVVREAPGQGPRLLAEYVYDNAGRRVWKEGFSYPSGGVVRDVRRYVHDGEAVLAELGESPGGGYHPVQRYLHGIGVLARERLEDDNTIRTRRPDAYGVPTRRPDADTVPTRRPDADRVRTHRPDAGPSDRQYNAATRSRNDTPGSGRPVRTPEGPGAGPGPKSPTALQTLFRHADGLGSTVTVTRSDGSVSNAYRYDAWGKARELEAGGACLTTPDLGFDGLVDWNAYLGNSAEEAARNELG